MSSRAAQTKRYIVETISSLKPGYQVTIARAMIQESRDACPFNFLPPLGYTTPLDDIMEQVVGSSYDIEVKTCPIAGDVSFHRLAEPLPRDYRTYVSSDRRHLYEQVRGNLWRYKQCQSQEKCDFT